MRVKLKYFALADAYAAAITSPGDNAAAICFAVVAAIQSVAATPAAYTFGRGFGNLEAGFSVHGGSSGPGPSPS